MQNHKWGTIQQGKFKFKANFTKIPAFFHTALYKLFSYELEKECLAYLLSTYTGDKWRVVIPLQDRKAVYVSSSEGKYVCLMTGEEFVGIPKGWVLSGSIHSHSVLEAFFSSVDDQSDFQRPGLHLVYGSLDKNNKLDIVASVTWQEKRYSVNYLDVIDVTPLNVNFHPKCLQYIKATEKQRLPLHKQIAIKLNNLISLFNNRNRLRNDKG